MIRDQALFVSGLLVEKLGGAFGQTVSAGRVVQRHGLFGMTGYEQAKGEGLWRRSLYTFWKRTILSPNMQVFDATAREFCTVRDTRTNTPLQSLNLMNDVTYIEAARMIAERMLKEGGTDAGDSAWPGRFASITSRQPSDRKMQVLLRQLTKQQLMYFRAHPNEADKAVGGGRKAQ